MHNLSSKELYLVNNGQTWYIYKDGFGENYKATKEEEAEWAKEVVANKLLLIETETNRTGLQFAIEALAYHKYEGLDDLLIKKLQEASPVRQIVFASSLWERIKFEKSFEIIYDVLIQHGDEYLNDVFLGLNNFKNNDIAKKFIIGCLEGSDEKLHLLAQRTVSMWAWSGLHALKENELLENLLPGNKGSETFKLALEKLKRVLAT